MKTLRVDDRRYEQLLAGKTVKLGRLFPGLSTESIEWHLHAKTSEFLLCRGYYAGAIVTTARVKREEL